MRLCLPGHTTLPIIRNEKFGTFSFWRQLSDKLSDLPMQQHTTFAGLQEQPITMARMNRLFGVSVSQLVSVDLETAAKFKEAV